MDTEVLETFLDKICNQLPMDEEAKRVLEDNLWDLV